MKPYYKVVASDSFRKFDTIEEAQSVAEGQAADHPGRAFEILRCVGIAQTSKASTFWMDGEEPPEKPRWRMLEVGESIQDGDEWKSQSGKWLARIGGFGVTFSSYHAPHRRPL